ncbi:MAG: hypothetical protein ACRECW_11880 [Phyllobacterium sp.]
MAQVISSGTASAFFRNALPLAVNIPDMAADEAKDIVDAAHIVCPYSEATAPISMCG